MQVPPCFWRGCHFSKFCPAGLGERKWEEAAGKPKGKKNKRRVGLLPPLSINPGYGS